METEHETCVSHVSEEEENGLRMHLLLTKTSSRAVRKLFDKEFHPSCLEDVIKKAYGKLCDLKIKRVINAAQWNLLFPHGGEPNSETFDVTLMVALLRNMADLPEPTTGYDQLPSSTDKTPMADVARIKHYRNQLAHLKDGKIQSELFSTAWEDINGAVRRLGGSEMDKECKDLRMKHLDQSTVPWNIRGQQTLLQFHNCQKYQDKRNIYQIFQ
ncbi:E3 ubiquitin-protein ligase DZIP3-like isoform X2 [Mytilus galloprovincialis]